MRKVFFTEPEAKLVRALVRNRITFLDKNIVQLQKLESREAAKRLKQIRKVRRKLGIVEYKISNPKARIDIPDPVYIDDQPDREDTTVTPKISLTHPEPFPVVSFSRGWVGISLLATVLLTGLLWLTYGRLYPSLLPTVVTQSVEGLTVLFLFAFFLMVASITLVYATLRIGGTKHERKGHRVR